MDRIKYIWIGFICICIGVIFSLCYYWHPYDGDDLYYLLDFSTYDGIGTGNNSIFEWPIYCIKHWVLNNGRAANYLFAVPLLSLFPKWINAIVCGGMVCMMCWMICYTVKILNNIGLSSFIIFLIVFIMPWWCSGFQLDVCCNYVLASNFILVTIYLWNKDSINRYILIIICFIAGQMHEAASLPIVCSALIIGFVKYGNLKKISTKLTYNQKLIVKSFLAGTIIVFLSPGIWKRFFLVQIGERDHFNGNWCELLYTTIPLVVIVVIYILYEIIRKSNKQNFINEYLVAFFWIIAALFSSIFVFAGKVIGNSGWFAELYSLCALGILMNRININKQLGIVLSIILFGIMMVHNVYIVDKQKIVGKNIYAARQEYINSHDEVIYYDIPEINEEDILLMGRVCNYQIDDLYTMTALSRFYKKEHMIILPKKYRNFENYSFYCMNDKKICYIMNDKIPNIMEYNVWPKAKRYKVRYGNKDYIVIPFLEKGRYKYLMKEK